MVKNLPASDPWVWEDSTCRGTSKPVCHSYVSLRSRAQELQLLKPACLEPVLCNKRSHCSEKPAHHNDSSPCLPELEKAHGEQ